MNETVLQNLKQAKPTVYINPKLESVEPGKSMGGLRAIEMKAAQNRLLRFMPYIESAFPETAAKKGLIESELTEITEMLKYYEMLGNKIPGKLYVKQDNALPIAGSIKARGGIHEVLKLAEELVQKEGLMKANEDHRMLDSDEFRSFFHQYTIQVGSTGNLGLSIGIMGAKLGFQVIVHMSRDAKLWKKELLRLHGVIVKEYDGDYSQAVEQGRKLSAQDPKSHFIDDENSKDLFMGYAAVGYRLKMQLFHAKRKVNAEHPLFVYLPCGVGGAPGGVTFGLKQMYGDAVHCFFVEPVQAPCVSLGMVTGKHQESSIYDIGLTGHTIADGLAVGRPSALAGPVMDSLLSGCLTVEDKVLLQYEKTLYQYENIFVEPSAAAGCYGVEQLVNNDKMQSYIEDHGLAPYMDHSTHIIWLTGGGLVPEQEKEQYLNL